ncbi:ATP-binding protein [Corallococcus macrosporus]|uniref:histidine kinase n=1 Tax=Myxococcus fulvus (strain ATCC BAA-855 / HW-1) TaxID=483219 RepID=F8CPH8_MYXFH|nr:ATP-binding protein [Corallococcus macrosporus]AEI67940.1 putative response regulator/sensor histidine kinase [Corallococcus macrosporus]
MSLVLVADDEPAVLEVLSQVVEDLGHDVLRARDGEEALGLARDRRPRLVVTDHMMPRLSGVELCRRMKQEAQLKDVPVILLSAVLPQGAPEAFAFLHKPFEITDFESVIHKSLAASPEPRTDSDVSPLGALGQWVARTLQGPLDTAREQLRRLEHSPAVDRAALATLEVQLQSLESVGRDLRELAWLSSADVSLTRVDTDLGQSLREAVAARGPGIRLEAPEAPVRLPLDVPRIRRVLDALLANAVRHGGATEVSLEPAPAHVTVRVKDSGQGLAPEVVARLFTPFRTDAEGAAGLELYVASELARLHGGTLSVESWPGQGSTFSLRLPRST